MVRWAVELSEFDIQYEPRGSIKGQVYADFVAELSPGGEQEVEPGSQWLLSVDGSSNQQGSGAGIVLEGPNGVLIEQALRFAFKASNNQAEYEALIAGMLLAKEMGAQNLLVKSASQFITGQVSGEFQAKDSQMAAYLRYVQLLKGAFSALELIHVPREQKARADLLAKLATSGKGGRQRTVIQETLKAPRKFVKDNRVDVLHISTARGRPRSHRSLTQGTVKIPHISTYVNTPEGGRHMQIYALAEGDTWMTPYRRYLEDGVLPAEPEEGKKVKRNAVRYTLVDGVLFKHGFTHPILTCVSGDECTRIMAELHEGICGSHVGGRSLASKVVRADAMIPVEINESSPRYQNFVAEESNEEKRVNLDLLEEAREEARIKAEAVKRRVERQYSSKVKPRQFQVGDLVMRKAHPYELENKLSPKWTGPFRVTNAKGSGSYNLETLEGGPIPRSWNAANLKFYFS
ncbi:uncharacterized protein [Phaseolus vulgaris]|uniref:uncharacterized protein n=1 Tax=Phaseolus vulgaris TaxID=3885 RepID=UPI0035CAA73D